MEKKLLTLLKICLVLSLVFVVGGCVKNKHMAGLEEETIGGVNEGRLDDQRASGEFMEVPGGSMRDFETSPWLLPVYFGFDKYKIKPEDKDVLSRNVSWLLDNPNTVVKIEGYCDERGTDDYNLALGDRRASATKEYLVSLGVEPSRILSISYGEEKPICSNKNENCWSQNRRAEFLVAKMSLDIKEF